MDWTVRSVSCSGRFGLVLWVNGYLQELSGEGVAESRSLRRLRRQTESRSVRGREQRLSVPGRQPANAAVGSFLKVFN
ncbi:hypothetical protein AAFF_G00373770 [Aldrovandia affinis]|uniref:Uncharacterized protein n=1 Tax=Aldrovandia affinis TaxID=143900 RepID=A0AAD7R4T9_9TELE|nr:hypothetical protein AAFF_G00373770 [Aldrovandia affinis]